MNIQLKKRHLYLLSLLSGVLLIAGSPANGFPLLLFFGFVPLLIIEDHIYRNKKHFSRFAFFGFAFIAMLVWNVFTTYWIYFSTDVGAILAISANALLMAFVLALFHYTRTVLNHASAYIALIIYWISFELMHLNWDLTWPWLTLGNGFANYPSWVQWYEYTGCFGGTLWILLVNYMIFKATRMIINKEKTFLYRTYYTAACSDMILIPVIISLIMYYSYHAKGTPANVVAVQPNIDPYNEKFEMKPEKQIAKLLTLARQKVNSTTDLLVGPETAIPEDVWESELDASGSIDSLRLFAKKYPRLSILLGMSSFKKFEPGEVLSATARRADYDNAYYDAYNTALMIDSAYKIQIYHKSKLVPGVEKMPFPKLLKPLEKYAINLGGTVGSLGIQEERTVFYSADKKIKAAPVICYESIYGEYTGDYVKNGANLICVITNDGWWRNTPGYKQHFDYARLRAIETRRSIVQSANTGISGFINQRGDTYQKTSWWKEAVIQQEVMLNEEITFYVKYGDYIARIAVYMSGLLFLYTLVLSIIGKFRKKVKSEK